MNIVCTLLHGTSGLQLRLYATIWSTSTLNTLWSSATGVMEAWNVANVANYAVGVTEVGQTGIYQFSFPPALQNLGETYDVVFMQRSANGAAPSQTDVKVSGTSHTFLAGKVEQLQINTA